MTPVNPEARIKTITVHTVVSLSTAACFNFDYSDSGSDERRVVVSLGHCTSSFVLTLNWVKAVRSFKFFLSLACVSQVVYVEPPVIARPLCSISFHSLSPWVLVHKMWLSLVPTSLCMCVCVSFESRGVCWGCFWSSLPSLWGVYHSTKYLLFFVFLSELNMSILFFFLTIFPFLQLLSLLSVGPGRECSLWRRISVHGEPSRAAPSSRENRGHRRLAAPLLPVSRSIYCLSYMHNYTHTHTHRRVGRCVQAHNPGHWVTFFISQRAICANQNVESSSERFVITGSYGKCRWSIRLCVNMARSMC